MSQADIAMIGLGVDTKGLKEGQQELDKLAQSSTKVEQAASGLRGAFSNITGAFREGVSAGIADATRELEQLQAMMNNPQLRLDTAVNARKALGIRGDAEIVAEIEATKRAYEDLKTTGLATASELNRAKDTMKQKIRELREEMGKWGDDWESIGKKAEQVGSKMQTAGAYITGLGAVGVGAVGTTVKAYADLEASSAILKSTMMTANGVSSKFEQINALAVELGNKLPGTTNDFNVMLSKLLQLGVSEEAILGGVGAAAANLAVVMKIPYEQAAEMTAKLKEAMGVSEKDMLKFMDTIQRVGHQGVDPSQMMFAFARSAGGLKQFGIQGEEASRQIAGLYAQLIKLGASGETVGTAFNSALNSMAKWEFGLLGDKRSAVIDDELKKLGITLDFFDDKTKEFKGVDNMIAQFDKLKNVDTESLQKIMSGMFGGGADQQLMIALTKGGTAAAQEMQNRMSAQANITERVGTQLDTLAAKWEAATGTFQNFLASLGEQIAPQLKGVVDWFGEVSAAAQTFVNENPELAKWLGLAVGGVGAAAVGAGTTLLALGSAIKGIGLALPLIASGWAGAVAFFTNPLVLAIAGVTAAAYAGYALGTFFAGQIDDMVKAVSDGKFLSLGDVLYEGMHGPNGLITIITKIPDSVSGYGDRIKQSGNDLMKSFRDGIKAGLKAPLGIGDKLRDALAHIKSTVADWVQAGKDLINGLWEGMKAEIRKPIEAVKQLAKDLPEWARKLLGIASPSKVFMVIGENIGRGLTVGMTSQAKNVNEAAKQLGTSAVYGVKDALDAEWLAGVLQDYESLKQELDADDLDATIDKFEEFDRLLATGAINVNEWAKAIAQTTLGASKASQEIPKVAEAVGSVTRAVGDSLSDDFSRVGEALTHSLSNALMRGFESGKSWLKNFRDNLVNAFSTMVLQPKIELISKGVVGMLGIGGASGAQAAGNLASGVGNLLSGGISSLFAPGAISQGLGMTVGGIAETLGMASSAAGALGSAVATAVPYIGWGIAILGALGAFGAAPSNRAAGGFVSTETGAVSDKWQMTGSKSPSQETLNARDATLMLIGGFSTVLKGLGGTPGVKSIGLDIGERDGVQFAKDGGAYQRYGANINAAIGKLFDEIVESTTGLEEHVKGLLLAFNGAGDEIIAFAQAVLVLSDYMKADPIAAATDEIAKSSENVYQKWQASTAKVNELAAAFDGSLSSAQSLSAAVKDQYQMEIAMIIQIKQLLGETQTMFGDSIEQIKLSVMDESAKYDFYRTRADEAYQALMTATDPAMIAKAAADVDKYTTAAYGLLDPEQQQQHNKEFVDYLTEADALATQRLNDAADAVAAQHEATAQMLRDALMDAAAAMQAAADTMQAAADTPKNVNVNVTVDNTSNAEVGVGYLVGG
ncbi:phage tail tape measure protein [Immundisolibacter sp.]